MRRLLLITVIALLAAATPAVAQDPVQDAYGGSGVLGESGTTGSGTPDNASPANASPGNASTDTGSSPATATGSGAESAQPSGGVATASALIPRPVSPAPGQQLPFTGFDIALLVLGGGLLLALGFGLRRASRDISV
jgi:hypothetical protein